MKVVKKPFKVGGCKAGIIIYCLYFVCLQNKVLIDTVIRIEDINNKKLFYFKKLLKA